MSKVQNEQMFSDPRPIENLRQRCVSSGDGVPDRGPGVEGRRNQGEVSKFREGVLRSNEVNDLRGGAKRLGENA